MLHDARARRPAAGNRIDLIGVPTDAGASCRGAALGPDDLRTAGLAERLAGLGYAVADLGDINVDRRLTAAAEIEALAIGASQAGYQSLENGARPVFLGGDHSISMGSVAGVARHCRDAGRPLFVLWFDAHGDFNTWSTTETGNIHGMSLARLCGEPGFANDAAWFAEVDPANVMILGARALDCEEAQLIEARGVQVVDMDAVRIAGVATPLRHFLDRVEAANGHLHLSLDVDAMDPSLAPGVGTTVPGGLTLAEGRLVMEMLHRSGRVGSLDLVELNPVLDRYGKSADLMVDLAARLFGEAATATRLARLPDLATA
ncbi:arginase [Devosia insulae DS-56]|uniref:Arginase n=1 Tax=Devosia insulae DS-56 TaxID=1116389 RepID=A0A1E5XNZ7_9HYPH|nr:arginase [Devosia insulae]OEO30289.1 arginase [Devosia insulae DS-56]